MGVGGSPKGTLISSGISTDIPWPSTVGLEAWLTTGGGASGKQDRGPSLTREKVQSEMKKGRATQGGDVSQTDRNSLPGFIVEESS